MNGEDVYRALIHLRRGWPFAAPVESPRRPEEDLLIELLDGADPDTDVGREAQWIEALYVADPMRLCEGGAPHDEYAKEAALFSVLETRGRLTAESGTLVFVVMFDDELVNGYAREAIRKLIVSDIDE